MIYLDNAATTKPSTAATKAAILAFEAFGNPSSLHHVGLEASKALSGARAAIAKIIGAKPQEIYFTSSGTEANNIAILGGAKKRNGQAIFTTYHEHSSVNAPLAKLTANGDFEITHDAQAPKIALATFAHVNSETGEIRDISTLSNQIKKNNPDCLVHVDAAQSFCKLPINVAQLGVDMLTMSAHKIGGLKGVGALYVRSGVNLTPQTLGGGQEAGLRSGTENMPGIMAFAACATDYWECYKGNYHNAQALKADFLKIIDEVNSITINGENCSPYILSISIEGIKSHILLNALSAQGVCVSTGSACSTKKQHKGGAEALRISFGADTTQDEITKAKEIFANCIKMLDGVRSK